ncbi:MAG: SDR family oxidoreductase [Anaerolineales bacterium]|nr:SDR family oxidoreductase [Anaerolineales bacterium]
MAELSGKRALITGGASGIGRATAKLFARRGAGICIADVDAAAGQGVADEIIIEGGRAIFVRCDVSSAVECQSAVQQMVAEFGGIDILFNNAGIIRRASVVDTTEDEWDRVMAVNVKSVFLLGKYVVPHMDKEGGGVIINISSGWGLVGGRNAASYCASKGAVVQLTRAMALDHGAQRIRVNCICPGDTDTDMLRNEAQQLGETEDAFLAEAADRPLQRVGMPEDIAQAALYLASEASSFITGTTLVVDGGGLAG